jgi:hypothetical protein
MSAPTYDLIISESSKEQMTYNVATFTIKSGHVFGNPYVITVTNPSSRNITFKFSVSNKNTSGTDKEYSFELTPSNGDKTITFTQQQLDEIYRCFNNTSNEVETGFVLETKGESKTWYSPASAGIMTLTGIAKTMWTSINSTPRRGQMWYGDSTNKPRRAILWVGDSNNKPRRCT